MSNFLLSNHILVVDDDRQIVRILQTYLTEAALPVVVAYDGEAALHLIRRQRPACVVLDLMLPGRNGWTRENSTLALRIEKFA